MPDLKLDNLTGDLAIVNGDLRLTDETNGEATAQRLRIRLRMWTGEWFLDTREGLPFREEILKKNPDMSRVEALVKTRILDTKGVAKLVSYSQTLDKANRTLTVNFRVLDASGVELAIKENIGL